MSDNDVNNDKKQKLREKYHEGGGKNLSEEQKEAKREYSRRRYKQMVDALKLTRKNS